MAVPFKSKITAPEAEISVVKATTVETTIATIDTTKTTIITGNKSGISFQSPPGTNLMALSTEGINIIADKIHTLSINGESVLNVDQKLQANSSNYLNPIQTQLNIATDNPAVAIFPLTSLSGLYEISIVDSRGKNAISFIRYNNSTYDSQYGSIFIIPVDEHEFYISDIKRYKTPKEVNHLRCTKLWTTGAGITYLSLNSVSVRRISD